jgi:Flp pilus assembly protein TadD
MRLGVALGAQQRFKDAVIELRTALTLRPDYPEARRFLMMAEERLQQR